MRFSLAIFFAFFLIVFALPPPQKPVVVSFPDNTPSSVIDKAIEEIKKDGGIITHEYSLIKGFAAKVSEATLTKISEMAESYIPYIEDDYVVHIDGSANTGNQ